MSITKFDQYITLSIANPLVSDIIIWSMIPLQAFTFKLQLHNLAILVLYQKHFWTRSMTIHENLHVHTRLY